MVVGVNTRLAAQSMSLTTVGFTVAAAGLSVFIWNDIGAEGPSAIVGGVLAVDTRCSYIRGACGNGVGCVDV